MIWACFSSSLPASRLARQLLVASRQRASNAETQGLHVADGFFDVVLRTDVQGRDRRIIGRVGGDQDHGGWRVQATRHAQHLQTRRSRKVLVGQHEIEPALPHQVDGFFGRCRGGDAVTAAAKQLAQDRQHDRLVVDHQDLVTGGDRPRCRGRARSRPRSARCRRPGAWLPARFVAFAQHPELVSVSTSLSRPIRCGAGRRACRDPAQQVEPARAAGSRGPAVDRVTQPLGRGRVVDDDQRRPRRAIARPLQRLRQRHAPRDGHDQRVGRAGGRDGAQVLRQTRDRPATRWWARAGTPPEVGQRLRQLGLRSSAGRRGSD